VSGRFLTVHMRGQTMENKIVGNSAAPRTSANASAQKI
jgi:hypothetical protein